MTSFLRPTPLILLMIIPATLTAASGTRPLLHPLFSDHAVLQRDRPTTIWGWAQPGTTLTVRFAGQTKRSSAGPDGKWACILDPLAASGEGRRLEVETDKPDLTALVDDVLVGDVWLCSGQSNMEMGITLCKEDEEIAQANHPGIRLLGIPQKPAYKPQETFAAEWKPCSPQALREGGWGGFSATAYFFGKKLHQELGIPIGLIHSSLGGTVAEAWTSAPALKDFPEFQPQLDEATAIAASTAADPEVEYLDAWFRKHDPGTAKGWFKADADAAGWREVNLPGNWADCGIPGYEGVVWAQRHIELPAAWAGKPLVVRVGEIADNDTTWLNGTVIGRTNQFSVPRRYQIEAGIAKPGTNTITLRVTNAGGGGILADQHPLCIHPEGDETAAIPLAGKWRFQETAKMADTGRPMVGNPNVPSVLYNGMIAPLAPYSLTGVIWYQGEANASRAHQYRKLLPALIHDWRNRFQRDDLAFHIVSLANYENPHDLPRDHPWAELREAQAMTAKKLPHCGLAVAIDIGESADIHPKNKRDVGTRLALSALANTYKKEVIGSGPWFRAIEVEGGNLRMRFDHSDGGLQIKGSSARSFAIAGQDRKFVWAKAVIDGDSIVVSASGIAQPVAVRYAWDSNPEACLYNGAGLPAVPFRSDDWPGVVAPILTGGAAVLAEPQPELLWPNGAPDDNGLQGPEIVRACIGNISIPTLTVYPAPKEKATGAAVVVIPGGGYGVVCVGSEGMPVVKELNERGITAVMLKYRLPNQHHLIPANDARRTIRMTRAKAADWGIDPKRVGVWGFSAGGHLASTVATVFDAGDAENKDPVERMSSRPDFAILFYPVISMKDEIAHKGSGRNLMGDEDLAERYSNELRVTAETPPCFLLHCTDDRTVAVENSLRFYQALVANRVPASCVIYEEGGHGPNAFEKNPSWEGVLDGWLKKRGCLN